MTDETRPTGISPASSHPPESPITHVAAFVDGWLARELEEWEARSPEEIRASLTALRRALQPHLVEETSPASTPPPHVAPPRE
jgi:hypothetical protein